jgi:hypothetical protein
LAWGKETFGLGTMDQETPLALAVGLELSTLTTTPLRRSIAAPPTRTTRRMLSMASPFPSASRVLEVSSVHTRRIRDRSLGTVYLGVERSESIIRLVVWPSFFERLPSTTSSACGRRWDYGSLVRLARTLDLAASAIELPPTAAGRSIQPVPKRDFLPFLA